MVVLVQNALLETLHAGMVLSGKSLENFSKAWNLANGLDEGACAEVSCSGGGGGGIGPV